MTRRTFEELPLWPSEKPLASPVLEHNQFVLIEPNKQKDVLVTMYVLYFIENVDYAVHKSKCIADHYPSVI